MNLPPPEESAGSHRHKGDLAEFHSSFLTAVERASEQARLEAQRSAYCSRALRPLYLLAGVLMCLALVAAVVLVNPRYYLKLTPANAEGFAGLSAVVISSYDRHVVPGVEIYELRSPQGGRSLELLVATTDSQGIFTLPPDDRAPARRFVLRHHEQTVGELALPADARNLGYERIQVDVPPQQLQFRFSVTVEPGDTAVLAEDLALALAPGASGAWTGAVIRDGRWPTEFNYGDVLAGTFRVDGPAAPGLTLRVRISPDQLALRQLEASQLRLITHSAEYAAAVAADPDPVVRLGGICHRGWYDAARPPRPGLPAVAVTCGADEGGEVWLAWQPLPGQSYAVLAPPLGEWQAGAVYLVSPTADGGQIVRPEIALVSQSGVNPATWIYDVELFVNGESKPYYLPQYPQANLPSIYALTGEPRGYGDLFEEHNEMYRSAAGTVVPAQYYLRRYDLTTAAPQRQGPLEVDLGFQPGRYAIHSSEPQLGSMVTLELTGDLERIVGQPLWDLDCNAVTDATGTTAELLATAPGSHLVTVTMQDLSGRYVRLQHRVNVLSDEGLLGCLPSGSAANYVVAGRPESPRRETSFWVISDHSIGGRPANSLNITNAAGPLMYLDPPAEWTGKQLKELRLVLFVSPRAGDYDRMFLSLNVSAVRATVAPADGFEFLVGLEGEVDGRPLELPGEPFQSVGICWPVELALKAEDDPHSGTTARETWLQYLKSPAVGFWVQTQLGFDVYNPPPNAELVAIMRELKASPYFSVRYATAERQELHYAAPLFGVRVSDDLAFLAGALLETRNILLAGQYEVYAGGDYPARVELETTDGEVFVRYFDYAVLEP